MLLINLGSKYVIKWQIEIIKMVLSAGNNMCHILV